MKKKHKKMIYAHICNPQPNREIDYDAACNGCGKKMFEKEIAYSNNEGDDYCDNCWEAIQGDPESLAGLKD